MCVASPLPLATGECCCTQYGLSAFFPGIYVAIQLTTVISLMLQMRVPVIGIWDNKF